MRVSRERVYEMRRKRGEKEEKSQGNEKKERGKEREREKQKVEENFDVRSYAIARGEGAPGPSFPMYAQGSSLPFTLRFNRPTDRLQLRTPKFFSISVSFSSYLLARYAHHRNSRVSPSVTGYYFCVQF